MIRGLTWLGIFTLLMTGARLYGQHGMSLVYAPSKVIKHRSTLLFDVPARTQEVRFSYTYHTSGDHKWERFWNRPEITINGVFLNFGNEDVLGHAIGLLPEMHFTLKRWKSLHLNLQFGTGIAYLNQPYNAISNPNNNAIGSNLNNISSLKFGLEYRWDDRWATSLSTGLVHFSNGLSSSPNSGINIYGLSIGTSYRFDRKKEKTEASELEPREEIPASGFCRWIVDAQYQLGFTEHTVPDGPKYAVQVYSLGVGYRYNEFMTAYIGCEYEYNDGKYTFFKRNFYSEEEALDRARSTIFYVENELRFGRVFNRLRLGFYLPHPIENSRTMYTKVMTGLYLPEIRGTVRPYIGVLLKTHSTIADYLGIFIGTSI